MVSASRDLAPGRETNADRRVAPRVTGARLQSSTGLSPAWRVVSYQRAAGNQAVNRFLAGEAVKGAVTAGGQRPVLAKGSKGEQVKALQQKLNALGTMPALKPDGDFGGKTHAAVVAFQTAHFPGEKKEWDGKVGKKTWAAIDEAYSTPEIGADDPEMGQKVVQGMDRINAPGSTVDSGVWYSYNYKAQFPDKYTPAMEAGYANPTYWDVKGWMSWKVKPKVSASAAIRAWLDGLTIAECNTAMVAVEYETLRAAVGNEAFDREFGSTDEVTPEERRLAIFSGAAAPHRNKLMKQAEAAKTMDYGKPGDRPASVGDWFYFMNHPRYLLKHPGGAWQGENSVYMGRVGGVQMWAGMGTSNESAGAPSSRVTEDQMLSSMVGAYNRDRDEEDAAAIAKATADNGGVLPKALDPASGSYPEKLTGPADILNAKPEKLDVPGFVHDDIERKGGFEPRAGKRLDAAEVQKIRDGGAED